MAEYRYTTVEGIPPVPILSDLIISSPLWRKKSKYLFGKIDSGADMTVIPESVVQELGLTPYSEMPVRGYEGSSVLKPTYLVNIIIEEYEFELLEVIASKRKQMLIGRDILNELTVFLKGKERLFEIKYP